MSLSHTVSLVSVLGAMASSFVMGLGLWFLLVCWCLTELFRFRFPGGHI